MLPQNTKRHAPPGGQNASALSCPHLHHGPFQVIGTVNRQRLSVSQGIIARQTSDCNWFTWRRTDFEVKLGGVCCGCSLLNSISREDICWGPNLLWTCSDRDFWKDEGSCSFKARAIGSLLISRDARLGWSLSSIGQQKAYRLGGGGSGLELSSVRISCCLILDFISCLWFTHL